MILTQRFTIIFTMILILMSIIFVFPPVTHAQTQSDPPAQAGDPSLLAALAAQVGILTDIVNGLVDTITALVAGTTGTTQVAQVASTPMGLRASAIANQTWGTSAVSGQLTGVQGGDLLTVALRERDGNMPVSISDSVNGAWNLTSNRAVDFNGSATHVSIYFFPNSSSGNPTITVTYAGNSSFSFYADAWSGIATNSVLGEINSTNNTNTTSHSHGSITTTGEALILATGGFGGGDTSITQAAGFTMANTLPRNVRQYKLSSNSETTTATFSTSLALNTSNAIAVFRAATSGTVPPLPPAPPPSPVPPPPPPPPPVVPPPPPPPSGGGRTLYVSPTGNDSVTYANNSASNPWATIGRAAWGSTNRLVPNASQAAQAGDTVIVNAGTYSTIGGDGRWNVAYNPVNSGTAGNPITFQANGIVTLTYSSGAGPMIGSSPYFVGSIPRNYITWRGFTINEANAPTVSDTGPAVIVDSTGSTLEGNTLIGIPNMQRNDNYNGIRIERTSGVVIRNNTIRNYYGSFGRNHAGITTYYSGNLLIENNEIQGSRNVQSGYSGSGIYLKADFPNTGYITIRNNLIYDHEFAGIDILREPGTAQNPVRIYQNIVRNSRVGISINAFDQGATDARHTKIVNNNLIGNTTAFEVTNSLVDNAGHVLWNNIISGGSIGINYMTPTPSNFAESRFDSEHNVFHNVASVGNVSNVNYSTLTNWKNVYSWMDGASPASIATDPLFVNASGGDYHLQSGSPARTIGVDYLDINANGSNVDIIPAGAYITGSETIGLLTGGGTSPPPPPLLPPPPPPPPPSTSSYTPTHFVSPNGTATWAQATNRTTPASAATAFANATAGNVVEFAPGIYSGVGLPNTENGRVSAFGFAHGGIAGNPIIFYAQNPANTTTNPALRSKFRDTAQPADPNEAEIPVLQMHNYTTIDGFWFDDADGGKPTSRGTVYSGYATTNLTFKRLRFDRRAADQYFEASNPRQNDNFNAIHFHGASNVVVTDSIFSGGAVTGPDPFGGVGPNRNWAFITTYGTYNYLIENNVFENGENGIFQKGSAGAGDPNAGSDGIRGNYGTIRFNRFVQMQRTISLGEQEDIGIPTRVYQNLFYWTGPQYATSFGMEFDNSVGPKNINQHFYNNTLVVPANTDSGGILSENGNVHTNSMVRNNIVATFQPNTQVLVNWWEQPSPTMMLEFDYNWYYNNGTTPTFAVGGAIQSGMTAWRLANGNDQSGGGIDSHAQVGNPMFVDASNYDFRLAPSSPARTASNTGGPVGSYITGNEVIGVSAGGTNPPPPPPPPPSPVPPPPSPTSPPSQIPPPSPTPPPTSPHSGGGSSPSGGFIPPTTNTNSGQGTVTPLTSGGVPPLTRNLYRGTEGSDVTILQQTLTQAGYLPEGNTTGYYGTLTEDAVKAFQRAQNIVTTGDAVSTGYGVVGPTTRARFNRLYGTTGSGGGTSQDDQTRVALMAQLQALLKQVADLQKLLQERTGGTSYMPPSSSTILFTRNLWTTISGDDVRLLQQKLAQDPTLYPEGDITGYFGPSTKRAIERFQCRHTIICEGDALGTGYGAVGPSTRAKLNEVYGG